VELLVDEGPGQVLGIDEGEEAALERASGGRGVDAVFLDEPRDRGCARSPWVPRDQGFEGGRAREPQRLGALGGAGELMLGEDRGEVEEGAGGVVTGMPWWVVVSSGARRAIWASMPGRSQSRATVVSMSRRAVSRMPHSPAAERWLRVASSPPARTAAIQRPWRVRARWPTA